MNLTEPEAPKRWLKVSDAATYTGFSQHYIRDAACSGRLKGYRSTPNPKGGHWRFLVEDLDQFVMTAALGPRWGRDERAS